VYPLGAGLVQGCPWDWVPRELVPGLGHPWGWSLPLWDSTCCRMSQSWLLTEVYWGAQRLVPGPGCPGVLQGQCTAWLSCGALVSQGQCLLWSALRWGPDPAFHPIPGSPVVSWGQILPGEPWALMPRAGACFWCSNSAGAWPGCPRKPWGVLGPVPGWDTPWPRRACVLRSFLQPHWHSLWPASAWAALGACAQNWHMFLVL